MLRFKQFVGNGRELERTVNSWLAEFEPDVTQMVQSQASDGVVVISFLYEESFRGQERRLEQERDMPVMDEPVALAEKTADDAVTVVDPGVPPADIGENPT